MAFTYKNRTKFSGDAVYVSRNHEGWDHPEDAVLIMVEDRFECVPPSTAREIAAALIEAADEFDAAVEEANKPKLPTKPGLYIRGNATTENTGNYAILCLDECGGWTYWDGEDANIEAIFKNSGGLKRLVVEGE